MICGRLKYIYYRPLTVKVNSLYDDTNKELEYALGRIKDEYILAEQREEESQRKSEVLNAILETTRNGIVVIGDDGKVVHFNQSLTKVLELSINITNETTIKEILYNVKENLINPDELISSLEELSSSHDVLTKICYFKDGRIIESSTLPFIDEGINKGMLSIFIDITDRVRVIELEKNIQIKQATIEKAREYDRLKDEFISIVSHELRTPLTIILGIIQLIDNIYGETDSCHVSQLASHLSIMKQNCFRLVKLTNNLIDINKIDSGFLDIKFRNQDIINAIEGITLSVAEYVKSKEINLIFDTEVEEKIMGFDSYLMERVMLNLLSNAVKFTEKGGKIEVDILDHEDRIVIKVRDNGIGIPKDKADVIFDRFMQVDTSLSRKSEGSGIGLSLVKLIVEEHKGKIYLNTDIDIGTEFIIELPVNLQENDLFKKLTEQDINMERLDIEFSDVYD